MRAKVAEEKCKKLVLKNEEKDLRIDELERQNEEKYDGNEYWVPKKFLNGEVLDLTEELESVRKQLRCVTGEFEGEILSETCKGQMESRLEEFRIQVGDLEEQFKGAEYDRDEHVENMFFHSAESDRSR